jgi:hypothetical protein
MPWREQNQIVNRDMAAMKPSPLNMAVSPCTKIMQQKLEWESGVTRKQHKQMR